MVADEPSGRSAGAPRAGRWWLRWAAVTATLMGAGALFWQLLFTWVG